MSDNCNMSENIIYDPSQLESMQLKQVRKNLDDKIKNQSEEQKQNIDEAFKQACKIDYARTHKWLFPNIDLPENYNERMEQCRLENELKEEEENNRINNLVKEFLTYLESLDFDKANEFIHNNKSDFDKLKKVFWNFSNFTKNENNKIIIGWFIKTNNYPKFAFNNACENQNVELAKLFVEIYPDKYEIQTEQVERIRFAKVDGITAFDANNEDDED